MAADFGFIAHATERHAHELAAERPRDRSRERRFADARRPDEAENRPLHLGIQLADRQIFENAVLRLLEAGVIRVQDALCERQIDHFVRPFVPRERHEPVEIRP